MPSRLAALRSVAVSGSGQDRGRLVEAMRALVVAKRSARQARLQRQPDPPPRLHRTRRAARTAARLPRDRLMAQAAGLRPGGDTVRYATKLAMRTLGRRVLALDADTAAIDAALAELVAATAPSLLELHGVGVDTAAILLVAAGDNPHASAPKPPGRTSAASRPSPHPPARSRRVRLNPGGNRQANHALWRIVITRMSSDPRTRDYVERRLAEGLSKREIIRCLKRYVAREIYRHLPR